MHICKISETDFSDAFGISEESFVFKDGKVQGARLGQSGDSLLVEGAKRFKLYTDKKDLVKILEGDGHFKWKQGETEFSAGDCFEADGVGEYEVNGSGKFLIIRK